MQDWLSGRVGKSKRTDFYAMEKNSREPASGRSMPCFSGPDSPYNRSFKDPIDLDLVYECLIQMILTYDPLPSNLTRMLISDIELLKSNRPGNIFRHGKNPTAHPIEVHIRSLVIGYVETAKERGLDDDPMKTIKEEFGIGKSTYYDWKKKSQWFPRFPLELVSDDEVKKHLRIIWSELVNFYSPPD